MGGFMTAVTGTCVAGSLFAGFPERDPHVVAKIADAARYEALNPHFAKAFGFLRRKDLAELPVGRYEIDGENCWAMIQEVNLTPFDEAKDFTLFPSESKPRTSASPTGWPQDVPNRRW